MVNRKPQLTGQNWFIVLNPLKSELERSKIAREIAKAFRIPADEAIDLVANTPIILLDNLNYSTAIQVKQYFCASVSDLIVSNDGALKRRCYRTVWPNPPSLTFLKDMDAKSLPRIEEEKLAEDEAIQEIRSWIQTENGFSEKETASSGETGHASRHFRDMLEEERERLLKENVGLRDNLNQIHRALEKIQSELHLKEKALENIQNEKKQKERETQEMQTLLNHSEEKYEMLREEFRQTRQYFEEKLVTNEKKSEELMKQIEEREIANRELMEEKQEIQKSFHASKNDLLIARDEKERSEKEWKERTAALFRELETQKKMVAEINDKLNTMEEGKKIIQSSEQRLLKEVEAQMHQTKRWELKSSELESEMGRMREAFEGQIKSWQLRLAQLESREHELEKARAQVKDLQRQLEHRELIQRKRELSESYSMKETQLKSLVKQQEKLESEIRHREEELRKLLHEQGTLEREVIEIKQAQRHLAERVKRESPGSVPRSQDTSTDFFLPRESPETSHD
ncbi:MAG TPA: hypothetical protein PK590_02730 [Candidatus Omnitrophota bacterium]|nr:hypothetical protein [Candidatus Omnitrophota bacterium]